MSFYDLLIVLLGFALYAALYTAALAARRVIRQQIGNFRRSLQYRPAAPDRRWRVEDS